MKRLALAALFAALFVPGVANAHPRSSPSSSSCRHLTDYAFFVTHSAGFINVILYNIQ